MYHPTDQLFRWLPPVVHHNLENKTEIEHRQEQTMFENKTLKQICQNNNTCAW